MKVVIKGVIEKGSEGGSENHSIHLFSIIHSGKTVIFQVTIEIPDRGNGGKTTSKSGLALNGIPYYGKPRTVRSGGSWL